VGNYLGPIYYYCQQQELPMLTSIVVRNDTGLPGDFPTAVSFPAEQQRVFKHDWFSIYPPTLQELQQAARLGRQEPVA
jgi:hypothetical protein